MTVVYEDEYMTITHHEDLDLLEAVSRFENEATYRRGLLKSLEVMEQCKPDKLLVDIREAKIASDPDLERWVDENITAKRIEFGIVKQAFVMASDFSVKLGVEEAMDNEYGRQLSVAYFYAREQAMDWLKETD